jgi:hypothetical protein
LGAPLPPPPTKLAPGSYYEAAANVGPGWRNLFSVSSDLPLDDFSFDGGLFAVSLQWVEAEATDPVTGEPRDMVGGMSSFSWDAHLSQDLAAYKWGVDVSGSDGTVSYRPNEFTVRSAEPYWSAWAEVKLPFDMTLRGGVNNITDREETVVRTLYDNPRDRGDIRYVENRPLTDGRYYYASLRRNF